MNPSGHSAHQRAELTQEEKAAVEAGLQDVFFGYDQWTLSEPGMEALNHDAAYLKDHPGATLKIEGHCDERGTTDYNMVLGDKRAKAARSYLAEVGANPKQVAIGMSPAINRTAAATCFFLPRSRMFHEEVDSRRGPVLC
jgi:peptidoglycan-associated lipoprotein